MGYTPRAMFHRLHFAALVSIIVVTAFAAAQTNCESGAGPLRPQVNVPDEEYLIRQVAARESAAQAARRGYTYQQEVTVQTLYDSNTGRSMVDGEYRQVVEVGYDEHGHRSERVTFAPQTSLRRLTLTPADFEDIRTFAVFSLTSEELSHYSVRYLGGQHVDELDTYVFQIAPRTMEKDKRYFQGKIWVEQKDLDVVKSCGRSVPDTIIDKKRRTQDKHPTFATYREQMPGGYWFPTYSRSDEYMDFGRNGVHVREIIRLSNYQKAEKAVGNVQSFDKKP